MSKVVAVGRITRYEREIEYDRVTHCLSCRHYYEMQPHYIDNILYACCQETGELLDYDQLVHVMHRVCYALKEATHA
jgi:hypothetical protein